jgi:DNA-binding LacI/PurR family transcriptional regulator
MRESGASQHSVERFLAGKHVHPSTRAKLAQAIEKLEHAGGDDLKPPYPGT